MDRTLGSVLYSVVRSTPTQVPRRRSSRKVQRRKTRRLYADSVKPLPTREPCGLIQWTADSEKLNGQLFTCARPGRSLGRRKKIIDDAAVLLWLNGLPSTETVTVIVSLLGRKPNEQSEFSYYSFRGAHEDRHGTPTFQEWLDIDSRTAVGKYIVVEHPTVDTQSIPVHLLDEVVGAVVANLRGTRTVVVVDPGGVSRTGAVIRHVGMTLRCRVVPSPITANCPSR
jgi:hypothetical protein